MRLLKILPGGGYGFETFDDDEPPPYAILSHRWGAEEVLYENILDGTAKTMLGYVKLEFCGERAEVDSILYFWSDTCCINKADAGETQRSINSMYKWYQRAAKCYVYLSDVSAPDKDAEARQSTWLEDFRKSTWFTRGWTLQELLAPDIVEFFSIERNWLGDRVSLIDEICEITELPVKLLRGHDPADWSLDERLNWTAKRTTTVKEDIIYCLLGLCGVFLSIIQGEGADYAEERLRDEFERRQRGRGVRNLHDLPVSLRLPFPRNELYVGRKTELDVLEQTLVPKGASHTHQRLTVYGLGGSGKSALALEFAYCAMAKDARLKVFWVPAISQRSFELAYREIGLRLRIPGTSDDNADVKKLVRDRLSQPSAGDWIIIVDNADDFNVLFGADNEQKSPNLLDWLPRSNRGSILFTTRNSKMAARLTPKSEHVCLERLGPAEAGQMLKRNILKKYLIGDDSTVNELLDILENLPLAIIQATAFINTNEITVVRYISLFRETRTSPVEIFSKNFHDESRYGSQTDEMYDGMDSTIAKTWHISFEQIRKQDPLAAEYLSFMACIDRINIPESVLPPEKPIVERLEAIGTLIGYAFIAKQQHAYGAGKEDFYDMHRLVHMSSILWLDRHGERATWARKALLRLLDMVPNGSHKDREVWTAYLPHAIYIVDHDLTMDDETKAAVLKRIGHCQVTLGQNATAEATYQRAFALRLKSSGEDDPRTLDTMNSIGLTLSNQGKYTAAEEMLRRTLKKQREVHGDDSRLTLTTSNNLASLLYDQGKYDDAEHMYRQNLELEKKTLEPGHPNILTSTGNLAFVLKGKQKNHEAEILYREVLKGQTRLHGREHPITMAVLGNLATALSSQGKKAEAISLTKEVLKYQEDTLGHDHPSTMVFLNNLACFLNEKDTYEQSEAMFTDLLARRKKVLGPEHPVTIATMSNLATCLDNQGKPEAEPSARESLRLSEKILTEHHPDTYLSVWGLAIVLGHQKQYEEAASLYAKAYDGLLACYGKEWNNTRQCRIDWDEMLAEQNDAQSVTSRLIYGLASFKVGRWKPFAKGDGRIISTH